MENSIEHKAREWWKTRNPGFSSDNNDALHERAMLVAFHRHMLSLSPSSPVDTDGLVEGIVRIAASELVVTDASGNMPVPGSIIRGFNLFKSRLSAYLEEQR